MVSDIIHALILTTLHYLYAQFLLRWWRHLLLRWEFDANHLVQLRWSLAGLGHDVELLFGNIQLQFLSCSDGIVAE